MKIYTKQGDTGRTMLFGGKKVSKISSRIKSLGEIDELNSILGVVISHCMDIQLIEKLQKEQSALLRLGADIATTFETGDKFQKTIRRITPIDVTQLEKDIDEWQKDLPILTQFILPGGSKVSAFAHHARSVCRRVERQIVQLSNEEQINPETIRYINRLSDWLFTLARYLNKLENIKDIINTN